MKSGMADVLLSGVETILKDPSFSTCSPVAAGVLTSTSCLKNGVFIRRTMQVLHILLKNY